MDADGASDVQNQPPAPSTYPVARETLEGDNVNTIDIFGERPFSV
jgi:hypothetical protein